MSNVQLQSTKKLLFVCVPVGPRRIYLAHQISSFNPINNKSRWQKNAVDSRLLTKWLNDQKYIHLPKLPVLDRCGNSTKQFTNVPWITQKDLWQYRSTWDTFFHLFGVVMKLLFFDMVGFIKKGWKRARNREPKKIMTTIDDYIDDWHCS